MEQEQPVRGRGRGRRGRGQARARQGRRLRNAEIQQQQEERRRMRRERVRAMVDNLDQEAMRALLRNLAERQPALLLDIWEQQTQAEGPAREGQPQWCTCGKCTEMPSVEEELCCRGGQDDCLSLEPEVDALVLDQGVLDLARMILNDVFGDHGNHDPNKMSRHAAYRQFIIWQYGRMGQGNRHVTPSCVVQRIRTNYPSPNGQYTGFMPGRLV